jgi:hypothetical protein
MRERLRHWRCFVRWPFGHRWHAVAEMEDSVSRTLRCSRCGKEAEVSKLPVHGEE